MSQITYTQKAQHKDLSDLVDSIAPYDTPFQSMIGKGKVTNTQFHWAEEDLGAPKTGGAVEGADAGAASDQLIAERSNYTQIFDRVISLSGSSQANKQAGNKQTLAAALEGRSRELKRDVEHAYVGTAQAGAIGSATTARSTAGYQAQIDAGLVKDAAGGAFTEDMLTDILIKLHNAGADVDIVMANAKVRSALTKVLQRDPNRAVNQDESRRINASVSIYTSDVGDVEIHNNRWVKYDSTATKGDILVMDSSKWEEAVLRPYKVAELAKTGDSDKRQLIVEKGLKNKNFKASGLITNVLA